MKIIKIKGYEITYPVGSHMNKAIDYIKKVATVLNDIDTKDKTISLFCTGSSGAILSSLLYSQLIDKDVEICHIKKEGENSHSGSVINYRDHNINIIIDDFACSGSTIERIYTKTKEHSVSEKIRIDYLILSGINYNVFNKLIYEIIKPLNFIITQQGIDNLREYDDEQEAILSFPPTTDIE